MNVSKLVASVGTLPNLLEDLLFSLLVFVFLVVLKGDRRSVDLNANGSAAGGQLDGVTSDVGLHGEGQTSGDLLGEDGVGGCGSAVSGDESPAVGEADGVGHVVVGANAGAVSNAGA